MTDEEQTQEAVQKPGVEAQLDALLGRIEEEQSGQSGAETAAAVSSSPQEPPETPPADSGEAPKEAATSTVDPEPAVDATEAEESLADQVQELLDQDQAAEDSAEALVPPAQAVDQPAGDEVESGTDPLGVQIDQLLDMAKEQEADQSEDLPATPSPNEVISDASAADVPQAEPSRDVPAQSKPLIKTVKAEAAAQPAPADAGASEGKSDSEAVKDLDSILADSADDAVAGDYDTIEQVLAEEQTATSAPAAQTDTTTAEAPVAGEPDDEELPEGMFETPEHIQAGEDAGSAEAAEPVAAPVGGGDFTARAEDVAKELAEQPESMPQGSELPPVTPSAEPSPTPGARGGSRARSIAAAIGSRLVGVAGRTPDVALRVCTTINKPVRLLPADWQNTVGYVGLLTLLNATMLLVYGLLSTAFAG